MVGANVKTTKTGGYMNKLEGKTEGELQLYQVQCNQQTCDQDAIYSIE